MMTLDTTQVLILALLATNIEFFIFACYVVHLLAGALELQQAAADRMGGQRAPTFPAPVGVLPAPIPVPVPDPGPHKPPIDPVKPPVVVTPPTPPVPPAPPAPVGSNFDKCVALVLQWEGGNDDDPRDPGGRTSRGILQKEWDAWRQSHPGLPSDVWQAPQEQILAIYKQQYWDMLRCDSLPLGVDYAVFDYGVNSGISRSAKALETIIGTAVDGHIGPLTIASVAKNDPVALINKICDQRMAFLQALPIWPTFGHGWTNRVNGVRAGALAMAGSVPKVPPVVIQPPQPTQQTAPSVTGGTVLQHNVWPTQAECPSFYGDSEATIRANLVSVHVPWLMNGKTQTIEIHKKCAGSLTRIVNFIWEQCGKSQDQIHKFGYDIFDGSFNWRPIAGTSRPSVHSYGAAIDFDAAANPQCATNTKFKSDSLITQAFETEAWIWGGRWSVGSVDAMHYQAARVR